MGVLVAVAGVAAHDGVVAGLGFAACVAGGCGAGCALVAGPVEGGLDVGVPVGDGDFLVEVGAAGDACFLAGGVVDGDAVSGGCGDLVGLFEDVADLGCGFVAGVVDAVGEVSPVVGGGCVFAGFAAV